MSFALEIIGFDHVEFAVRDLERALDWSLRLGFEELGRGRIPERQVESVLMGQRDVRFVLSHSASKADRIHKFVTEHGDGVLAVGLAVPDATTALEVACSRGARFSAPPRTVIKDFGDVQTTSVTGIGDVQYTFVSRSGDLFLEGFNTPLTQVNPGVGVQRVRHLYAAVDKGTLDAVSRFHQQVFGWEVLREWEWEEEGRRQRLVAMGDSTLSLTLTEPLQGSGPARTFLEVNHGPGIQGLLLDTEDLPATQARLAEAQIALLPSPPAAHLSTVPLVGPLSFEFRPPDEELPIPSVVNHFLRSRAELPPTAFNPTTLP